MADQQADLLSRLAQSAGLTLTATQAAGLEKFVALLLAWNARMNLTGARSRDELVGEHLGDAFAMAQVVPQGARVLDVGSGGGLPAIPFAILRPDVTLTLVEPRQKRVAFLRAAVRERGLSQVGVEAVRLEALTADARYGVASSRATFAPGEWLRLARPRLEPGGRVLVFAARLPELEGSLGYDLADQRAYETAAGHPRWLGVFVPRST